jgi:pyrroloquinoline quinone (PQQ) biosynthesis protein C
VEKLSALGIPPEAMTFLAEHAKLDPGHTRLLESYIAEATETREDVEAIIHGIRGAAALHGLMLQGILDSAAQRAGWSPAGAAKAKTARAA